MVKRLSGSTYKAQWDIIQVNGDLFCLKFFSFGHMGNKRGS